MATGSLGCGRANGKNVIKAQLDLHFGNRYCFLNAG